ncbi:hypothetical protein GTA62_14030 [Roseobacter sp. HKCCD9010]|uniref:hypothetical protein n=1 Tax=Rhodobacterales TaxID=204455 RepID=UPI001490F1BC|nr:MULTISPECIES: hypothetical protein [Rhodobacterales]MBF9050770.1 hypothetical protein [Rhodobacterales bacterium HKCCD4356]NNV11812.1 hypothetical protein [Roseobacter sp. HKCCD7357]NNV17963.1 hypothetical protein [Roseobacter sp. HKCCD8768]NNV26054.1 hypothetical protein [Roseobacter sp. HKCCD8192]NNV31690.1 hypothetical protein [Roseobacter sp. HKCCD9061]
MPNLSALCLRYLMWIVALRVLHILAVQFLGLPNTLGTTVILAAAPAADIGMQALRRAGGVLDRAAWGQLALALFGTYLAMELVVIGLFAPQLFATLLTMPVLIVWGLTLAMIMLFLWIGARQEARR